MRSASNRSTEAALVLLLCVSNAAAQEASSETRVAHNLDFQRPSLLDAEQPWGWWLQPFAWRGVQAALDDAGLRLERAEEDRGVAQGVYDFMLPLAGRELRVEGTLELVPGSRARVGIGLQTVDADGELGEAWARPLAAGSDSAATAFSLALATSPSAANTQLLIEFAGTGVATVSPLRLFVDGQLIERYLPGQSPPAESLVDWVRARAVALRTTDPAAPLRDLAPLASSIGDATFVLLGESTHGTREFFQLRHRLIRWLLEEQGFGAVAIEDHYGSAAKIDRFVQTGSGTAREALRGVFAVWGRQETLDMVAWMRTATAAGSIDAAFVGCDLQVPLKAFARLESFAAEHDGVLEMSIQRALGGMRAAWEEGWYPRRSEAEHARWSRGAEQVLEQVRARRADYAAALGAERAQQAFYDARLIWQSAQVSLRSDEPTLRDRFMAENLDWLQRRMPPGTRMVLWAHNAHVRRDRDALGEHLARLRPGEVLSVGLATNTGEYTAYHAGEMRTYPLLPGPPRSVEALLHRTGLEVLALDLRRPADDPLIEPLRTPYLHRGIGLTPADFGFYPATMSSSFDLLFYVDHTSATRALE